MLRNVLDRSRRQRHHRFALLPNKSQVRGLLGRSRTGGLILHFYVAHPRVSLEVTDYKMAVRVGFEPTEPAKVQRFSRPPDSTTLAPHRILILPGFHHLRTLSPRHFSAQWAVSPIWHHFPQSTQPPAFLHRGSCGRSASSQILTNGLAVPSPSLGPHHFW